LGYTYLESLPAIRTPYSKIAANGAPTMPLLKNLNCSIELSHNQQALQEFGTIYGDGFVETFVPVPNKPQSFSVHLTSNKFIAPGVAIFVYVDGVYQCNRNRQDLKLRKPSDSRSLVDFRVRQKEEKQKDGSMIAREWTFDKLNISRWYTCYPRRIPLTSLSLCRWCAKPVLSKHS
jgi:hypothetical protein